MQGLNRNLHPLDAPKSPRLVKSSPGAFLVYTGMAHELARRAKCLKTLSENWTLERSPFSSLFPDHDEEDVARLYDSIEKGDRTPTVKLGMDGTIIDGWRRYDICRALRRPFILDDDSVGNELNYVLQENLNRRHLTSIQAARNHRAGNARAGCHGRREATHGGSFTPDATDGGT